MEIKHLYSYTAAYEDGTVIEYDKENPDISEVNTTKSKFFDIQEKEKESKLISFVIHNDTQSVGVDLRDGHFEVNGTPFFQHRPDLIPYKDFRIIFYRTVRRTIHQNGEEIGAEIYGYTIGWQTSETKENIQKTITI